VLAASADNFSAEALRPSACGRVLLIVLVASVAVRVAVVAPVRNYLLDFRGYYAAGCGLERGISPYDTEALRQAVQLPGRQSIVPYMYPPPTLALAYVFSRLPYPEAQIPWIWLQFTLALGALLLLLRLERVPPSSPVGCLVALLFMGSGPFAELFRWGQFDMIVLALFATAAWADRRGRSGTAGVLLGLAIVAKVTPAPLLAVWLLCGRWKSIATALTTVALLFAASGALLGTEVFAHWHSNLSGLTQDVTRNSVSLRSVLQSAFLTITDRNGSSQPWVELAPSVVNALRWALLAVMTCATAAHLWIRRQQLDLLAGAAVIVPLILVGSPITWPHHGVILLAPLISLAAAAVRAERPRLLEWVLLAAAGVALTVYPVQEFQLQLPSWLGHLVTPTPFYVAMLLWIAGITRHAAPPGPAPRPLVDAGRLGPAHPFLPAVTATTISLSR
jgi:Glycosyltransferase family 87